jgi:hypothetical protein
MLNSQTDEKMNKSLENSLERYYQENVSILLSSLKLKECLDSIKPIGFRPILMSEDINDLPCNLSVDEIVKSGHIDKQLTYTTIILPNEAADYKIYLTVKNKDTNEEQKGTVSILLFYSSSQKGAFRNIFFNMINSSMVISDIALHYGQSDEYNLGELCLVRPSPIILPNKLRNKICFIRNSTAFIEQSRTIDVSSLAKYLDAKYDALTKELNSPPAFRKWFMLDGIFSVEGKYVSSDLVKVVLADKDGKQSEIELSKLSPTDKLYTKRRYEINKATKLGKQTVLPEAIAGTKLNVTEPKIVFPNDLEYRKFESFDGQYFIEAKLVSFEIDKDNKKIVTLEKKDNHKKIPTHLDKLSKDDQNYIQEKIDTQKKNKLDPQPKH